MDENDKALPLEALGTRDNEVFCEHGHSLTIRCRVQLQFVTELADFGDRMAENDKVLPLEALRTKNNEVF